MIDDINQSQDNSDSTVDFATAEPTAEQKIAILEDKNLRLVAEMENMRVRFEKERADALKFGAERFAADIITAVDTLDMALQSIQQNAEPKMIVTGIEMVQKELLNIFERHHIKKFKSLGESFDPQKHDAMMEVTEGNELDDTIVREIKPGYTMYGKLLRPAAVAVKKTPEPEVGENDCE